MTLSTTQKASIASVKMHCECLIVALHKHTSVIASDALAFRPAAFYVCDFLSIYKAASVDHCHTLKLLLLAINDQKGAAPFYL